jgi:hypothetical protein
MGGEVLLGILLVMYVLPAILASLRGHSQAGAIWVLNLLLGWTVVGWVGSLVWACTTPQPTFVAPPQPVPPRAAGTPTVADQIAQFSDLKDRGIISADEFEAKKRQLLGLA